MGGPAGAALGPMLEPLVMGTWAEFSESARQRQVDVLISAVGPLNTPEYSHRWSDSRWNAGRREWNARLIGCASHSRYFWGLRLHLVCTLTGLPVMFALADAKADERETLLGMLEAARDVTATRTAVSWARSRLPGTFTAG